MFKVNNNQQIIKQTLFNKPAALRKKRIKIITQNKSDIKSLLGIRGAHFLLLFSCIDYITSVEPVKATLSISIWWEIAAPAVGPKPGTIFTTPGGNPAWIGKKTPVNLREDYNYKKMCCMVFPFQFSSHLFLAIYLFSALDPHKVSFSHDLHPLSFTCLLGYWTLFFSFFSPKNILLSFSVSTIFFHKSFKKFSHSDV